MKMDEKHISMEYICTVCPKTCRVMVEFEEKGKIKEILGAKCEKGVEFVRKEIESPERILTTTVRTNNPVRPLLPVKTDRPIPKSKLLDCMKEVRKVVVSHEVGIHHVLIENILNTGGNLITTDAFVDSNNQS